MNHTIRQLHWVLLHFNFVRRSYLSLLLLQQNQFICCEILLIELDPRAHFLVGKSWGRSNLPPSTNVKVQIFSSNYKTGNPTLLKLLKPFTFPY